MQANVDRLKTRYRLFKWTALSEIRTETLETVHTYRASVREFRMALNLRTCMFTCITHTGRKIIPIHHRMHLHLDKEKHVIVAAIRRAKVQVKNCY